MRLGLTATGRRKGSARWMIMAGVAALLLGSGCTQEAGDDPFPTRTGSEATARFLADAAERSATTVFRFEAEISMAVREPNLDVDLDITAQAGYGEQQGDRMAMVVDAGWLMEGISKQAGEPMPPELEQLDLTVEMVADPETQYVRAPFYAQLSDMLEAEGAPPGAMGPLAEIGDGWGRIDVASLGDRYGLADVQSALGAPQIGDPTVYLELVAGVDEVRELGDDEIRGVSVRGLAADIPFADLLEQQGIDAEEYVEQVAGDLVPGSEGSLEEMLVGGALPVEVWVDDEGYVRRLSFDMELTDILPAFDSRTAPEELSFGMSMDFFDYGDESIEVELPEDWVDVTDELVRILESPATGSMWEPDIGTPMG